jgi:hypothetical protein
MEIVNEKNLKKSVMSKVIEWMVSKVQFLVGILFTSYLDSPANERIEVCLNDA